MGKSYTEMADEDIAAFTESITAELHAHITGDAVRAGLAAGNTAIHRYPEGYCIINRPHSFTPYLWVMYVDPEQRGTGAGAAMMEDIISRYCHEGGTISLQCHESLEPFYRRFGFRIVDAPDSDGQIGMEAEFEAGEVRHGVH